MGVFLEKTENLLLVLFLKSMFTPVYMYTNISESPHKPKIRTTFG